MNFILIIIIAITTSDYDKGWSDGYVNGWKSVKGQNVIDPPVPFVPTPRHDCYKGYSCGYDSGFVKGRSSALI